MAEPAISVDGLAGAVKALGKFDVEAKVALKAALKASGELVRKEAAARFDSVSPKSALGYRVYMRAGRVDVEQSLRKTTGRQPQFGALQMRTALIPALDDKRDEIVGTVEGALAAATERL